jgi:hypothetical protein
MPKPKKDQELEPVSHDACQADVKGPYSPFQLGAPPPQFRPCGKKPSWYAREAKAGPDGRKGAMSLCDGCKAECEKRLGDAVAFEPLVGWNEKFHQLYDNPGAVPRDEIQRVLRDAGADAETAAAFEQLILARWASKQPTRGLPRKVDDKK